jgi:hypothetical protein
MKASIFFTSPPVSQLGLACDGVAAEPATGAGIAIPAAGMYSSGVAIHPRLRDVQALLLGRDRRPRVALMTAKSAEEMTNTREATPTPSAWQPAARGSRLGARGP